MALEIKPIRLLALDEEDLAVISAHTQDAVLAIGDLKYFKSEQRFVIVMNRFDRRVTDQNAQNVIEKGKFIRRRSVLNLDRVQDVKQMGLRGQAPDTILNLLAVTFDETEAPSGTITLVFSGDVAIRLTVEVLEARLGDLDATWVTSNKPNHGRLPDLADLDRVLSSDENTQSQQQQQQ